MGGFGHTVYLISALSALNTRADDLEDEDELIYEEILHIANLTGGTSQNRLIYQT